MHLLGIDVGTTHCKAGIFKPDGSVVAIATRPTRSHKDSFGDYYDPEEMWATVQGAIYDVTSEHREVLTTNPVKCVGIASMAESGLLIDRSSGKTASPMLPWFDKRAMTQLNQVSEAIDPYERFCKTGVYPSYKYGLVKILWLKSRGYLTKDCVWLSAADYIAYKLTGRLGTDYSLATRTYAFRIDTLEWDEAWITDFGLSPDLFPKAQPSGTPLGTVNCSEMTELGLRSETVVSVSGHDHVCAALAVGATTPGIVYDSMGTAETLMGTLNKPPGRCEFESGLSYGPHVVEDSYYWMGGISSSGGSVEWLRKQLGDTSLSYKEILELLSQVKDRPSDILYYPYLSGSGAPNPNPFARGAFIGIKAEHGKGHLLKAVLEGTAYEMESIREAAQIVTGQPIHEIVAVGGGTKNLHWVQIKADVSGCPFKVSAVEEATLLGAALVAGVGCGVDIDFSALNLDETVVSPNILRNRAYHKLYTQGYLRLQTPLRDYYDTIS